MYNNNYVKCPICKVVFENKYIQNHYINCLKKYKKIRDIKNNLLQKKKEEEYKQQKRKNETPKRSRNQENQLALYKNNLYKLFNTTNINEKYTYYYQKYLCGKNVAIVGPASSIVRTNSGRLIDTFDVVVRLNKSLPLTRKLIPDIGSRTDILYNSLNRSDFPGENILDENFFIKNGLKFLCTSYPNIAPFNSDIRDYLNHSSCKLPFRMIKNDLYYSVKNAIHTRPNTGIMAIVDLLNTKLRKLYITGLNFYKTSYYKNYQSNNQLVPYSSNNIHNQNTQIQLLRHLTLVDDRIIIDKVLHKILFHNYINFFKQKKSIDNDNIFKLKTEHHNILFEEYNNPIFIGRKQKNINITKHDLIICMTTDYIQLQYNIPIISLQESSKTTALINIGHSKSTHNIIEYKCNKKYYNEFTRCMRSISIYKFSIELFIYMSMLYYFPNMDSANMVLDEENGEKMLYTYYQKFRRNR